MRSLLTQWRDQGTGTPPSSSFLLGETAPLSRQLSALGAAGLQALDYLDRQEQAPAAWSARQLALAQEAGKPQAQLLLVVAPAVESLIRLSAGQTAATEKPATN